MGIERKISRNALKKTQGNNKIKDSWQDFMNFKYSFGEGVVKRNVRCNEYGLIIVFVYLLVKI